MKWFWQVMSLTSFLMLLSTYLEVLVLPWWIITAPFWLPLASVLSLMLATMIVSTTLLYMFEVLRERIRNMEVPAEED